MTKELIKSLKVSQRENQIDALLEQNGNSLISTHEQHKDGENGKNQDLTIFPIR